MTTSRDAFLERVRAAVEAGNRAGSSAAVEDRAGTGYQGAAPDPVARFCGEFTAAGGFAHLVPDPAAAVAKVLELVQAKEARRVLIGPGPVLEPLRLLDHLRPIGIEAVPTHKLSPDDGRENLFSADLGISGVDYLVAETGTIVVSSGPDEPRSLSLLPPVHLAIAARHQVLPDLFDLFEVLAARRNSAGEAPVLPSCLTLITGPSKTGDIELRLVTGVHGPGEVHLILLA